MIIKNKIFVFLFVSLFYSLLNAFSLYDCSTSSQTCSASFCEMQLNPSCNVTQANINYTSIFSSMKCNPNCNQSTLDRCNKTNLASTFLLGSEYGNHIKAIYCTDKYLIIHSDGYPNHQDFLSNISFPPSGNCTDGSSICSYNDKCVIRDKIYQSYSYKIPLNVTLLSSGIGNSNQKLIPSNIKLIAFDLPNNGPSGVAINGLPIFPGIDDQNTYVWEACGIDGCNARAGKGFDYHYHGDPYGENCLYTEDDFTNNHPTLIGYGLDGIPIHGRYTDFSQEYAILILDECGGHKHGVYGYHYHSQVLTLQSQNPQNASINKGKYYQAYLNAPYQCWKGDISLIDNFFNSAGSAVNYDNSFSQVKNTPYSRNDYQQLLPCCNMSQYITFQGINLTGVANGTTGELPKSNSTNSSNSDLSSVIKLLNLLNGLILFSLFIHQFN